MATERSKAKGVNGARNGAAIPFRYQGGSFDRPIIRNPPEAKMANVNRPSDFRDTSMYAFGMYGGLLASRLGFDFHGSKELEKVFGNR